MRVKRAWKHINEVPYYSEFSQRLTNLDILNWTWFEAFAFGDWSPFLREDGLQVFTSESFKTFKLLLQIYIDWMKNDGKKWFYDLKRLDNHLQKEFCKKLNFTPFADNFLHISDFSVKTLTLLFDISERVRRYGDRETKMSFGLKFERVVQSLLKMEVLDRFGVLDVDTKLSHYRFIAKMISAVLKSLGDYEEAEKLSRILIPRD